jgi:hypothetical protein
VVVSSINSLTDARLNRSVKGLSMAMYITASHIIDMEYVLGAIIPN